MYNDVADTNFWNLQKDVLLDWHYYDQVDAWELNRTWAIASYQENQPNPFVLDSSLARRIWYMNDSGTDTTTIDTLEYQLIINEIMQNPSAVSDANGEWFEIYNNSDEEIDLNGFTIKDNDTDSHQITLSVLLPPFSFSVLGRNSDSNTNGGLIVDYQYEGITLANGDDEILLIDPNGNTIDSVAYDGGSTFPDPNGATMALLELNLDNNIGGNWVEYDSLTYGDGDYGTPGALNFPLDIEWDFSLSEPIITVFGDDDEWNPEDTISIKMELCNNSDYDHGYYPGAMLEADSNLVTIMNENWFYGMMANTCDSVVWNVIANNIEFSTQVEFIAYPTILNCEDNPEFCFEGDTISFSIPINVDLVSNDDKIIYPKEYHLYQNYPNPFNPVTTLRYDIPENAFVNIRIYDLKGRLVKTLVSKEQTAGYKAIKWVGVDNKGQPVSAGIYLYEIQAGEFRQTKKMVLLK